MQIRAFIFPLPAALLTGCASIDTGLYQSPWPLPKGGCRAGVGLSTGLHLEEANHGFAEERPTPVNWSPLYRRDFLPEASLSTLALLAPGLHAGYGLTDRTELHASLWGGLNGQGARAGAKWNVFQSGDGWYLSAMPRLVYAWSEGGKAPLEEDRTGHDTFLQHLIFDKEVHGVEVPLSFGYQELRKGWYLVPSYSRYRIDVSKAYYPDMAGVFWADRLGMAVGLSFKPGPVFLRPELSVSWLKFSHGPPATNLNLAFGVGFESRYR